MYILFSNMGLVTSVAGHASPQAIYGSFHESQGLMFRLVSEYTALLMYSRLVEEGISYAVFGVIAQSSTSGSRVTPPQAQ